MTAREFYALGRWFCMVDQTLLITANLTSMNRNIGIMYLTFRKSAPDRIVLIGFGQPFGQRSFDNILGGHTLYQPLKRVEILRNKLLIWLITERFPTEFFSCTLDHSQQKIFILLKAVLVPRHIYYIKADSTNPANTLVFLSEEHHKAFLTLRFGKPSAAQTKNVYKNGSTAV